MKNATVLALSLVLGMSFFGAGCKKKGLLKNAISNATFGTVTVDAGTGLIRLKPGTSIKFATNSDEILDESKPILDDVVAAMTQQSTMKVRLEGHTDADGADDKNLELSTRRAAAVKAYLESKGIAADRVESMGCGETAPLASNDTDEGKQQNRRVEFVILNNKGKIPTCQVYQPAN